MEDVDSIVQETYSRIETGDYVNTNCLHVVLRVFTITASPSPQIILNPGYTLV
jgi:hypothetical protein